MGQTTRDNRGQDKGTHGERSGVEDMGIESKGVHTKGRQRRREATDGEKVWMGRRAGSSDRSWPRGWIGSKGQVRELNQYGVTRHLTSRGCVIDN